MCARARRPSSSGELKSRNNYLATVPLAKNKPAPFLVAKRTFRCTGSLLLVVNEEVVVGHRLGAEWQWLRQEKPRAAARSPAPSGVVQITYRRERHGTEKSLLGRAAPDCEACLLFSRQLGQPIGKPASTRRATTARSS